MLSNNHNQNSSLVRKDTSLVSLLNAVLSYSAVFTVEYKIPFLEACNNDIALELSGFLGGMSSASYKRYVRLSKVCLTYPTVQQYLFNNTSNGKQSNSIVSHITYVSDGNLLSASQ